MDLLFPGARVTFGVSELSGVVVVVVATMLGPDSKIVVGVVEPDGVPKLLSDKFCINRLAVGSENSMQVSPL